MMYKEINTRRLNLPKKKIIKLPTEKEIELIKVQDKKSDCDNVKDSVQFEESGWECFSGRETRAIWWESRVILLLFSLIPSCILSLFLFDTLEAQMINYRADIVLVIVFLIMWLGSLFYSIPHDVRRLHDRNMSGWLILANWLVGWLPIVGWIFSIFVFINLGFLDGTVGDNCYGKDPKDRKILSNENTHLKSESVEIRLQKVKELFYKEIITKEEYDAQRQRILADL